MSDMTQKTNVDSARIAEQRVAAFMAERGRDILNLKLSEISAACQVSDATVVRYCNHIGYKGLKDFKIAIAHSAGQAEGVLPIHGEETLPELKKKIFSGCVDAIQRTDDLLSPQEVERALRAIAASGNLDVYATGGSVPIGSYLRHQLIKLGIRTILYSDKPSMLLSQARLSERDTVLAILCTGCTQDVVEAQTSARRTGATLICLTANPDSPLSKVSDIRLVAVGEHFLRSNTYSRLSQLAVVDVLYAGLAVMKENA